MYCGEPNHIDENYPNKRRFRIGIQYQVVKIYCWKTKMSGNNRDHVIEQYKFVIEMRSLLIF